jgi:uncharacterized protein YkwD
MFANVRLRRAAVAIGLGSTLAGPLGQVHTASVAHAASFSVAEAERRLFDDINNDRAANGRGPLQWNGLVGAIARDLPHKTCGLTLRGRSQDMIDRNYLAHAIPPCGAHMNTVLDEFHIRWSRYGENIYSSSASDPISSADEANAWLMGDAPHRDNILGMYNQVGVGAAVSNGRVMFTMDFLNSPDPPAPAPPGYGRRPSSWSRLDGMGGSLAGRVAVGPNSDTRLEAFARGVDGAVWHSWQVAPNTPWTSFYSLGGSFTQDPAVGLNTDGRLEVFVSDAAGAVSHVWQTTPSGGWSGFYSLGSTPSGPLAGRLAVATNADGRVEIFARDAQHALWHNWQVVPSGGWSGWYSLAGSVYGEPSAGRNGDGRLEVFATQSNGSVAHIWQTAPGQGWTAWYGLGGSGTGSPAVASNADGRVEVFARGTDNALWHTWQVTPNSGWTAWYSLGGTFASDPAAGRGPDGSLEAFALSSVETVFHTAQDAPGGGWSAATTLDGGLLTGAPSVAANADGRLEVFGITPAGGAAHAWQQW